MSDRLAKKLLIVGWDAADWMIIDQLFAAGQMPHLKRLVDTGVRADLATLEPRLSPLLWTSIATGKTADKHGILNFVEPDPVGGGVRISSSTSRKTKALWNILTQAGLRTNVVSWYASHPAEPINGICVSNLFQEGMPASLTNPWPLPPGAVHPVSADDGVSRARVHQSQLDEKILDGLVPQWKSIRRDERTGTLARLVAQCVSVHQAALEVIRNQRNWDCTMVFHDTIDTVGHHFMQFHPPRMSHVSRRDFELFEGVMKEVYRLHDQMLGVMLHHAGPETTMLLLSDHGFYSDHLRPVTVNLSTQQRAEVEASWHRPYGVLTMAGQGIRRGETVFNPTILDLAPTALRLLGLPVGQDMDGRVLNEAIDGPRQDEKIPSWDEKHGESGQYPADRRQDPFDAHDALQQLVDLGYMAALPQDAQAKVALTRLETQFNLAVVLSTTNRPRLALPEFEELVSQKPDEARYVLGLAKTQYEISRPKEAAATLRTFLARHVSHLEASLLLVGALATAGDNAGAIKQLKLVEQKTKGRRDLALTMGDICSTLERWIEAEGNYRAAIQHEPGNPLAHLGLARAAIAHGQFEAAIEHALDALDLRQSLPEGHYLLGAALAWIKDYPNAIQSLKVAVSMQPGYVDAHQFLASILTHQGQLEAASLHHEAADRLQGQPNGETNVNRRSFGASWGAAAWNRSIA